MGGVSDFSEDKLNGFLKRHGKHGESAIGVLRKTEQFMNAIQTPLGKELTQDLEKLLDKTREEILQYTPEQANDIKLPFIIAKYQALRELAIKWNMKIAEHDRISKEIQDGK